ncbi:MAG: Uma2 family endonuclease [Planctomycetaceae bacterium]|nr:Uma2 family endonuclease [Planctomycetaceae bacterium]
MSLAATKKRFTPQEYLALERKSEMRNEYYNGEIFAMAGASREHNLIAGNVNAEIRDQILDRPCESYPSDMRVYIEATGLYTYPDVTVVCGEPRFQDREVDTLLNPMVIVEVLSPTTEAYDRGDKFRHYRRIGSLREFVLISQDQMMVERYTRQGNDWVLSDITDPDQVLKLESIGCQIPLGRIYAKVKFPEPGATEEPTLHPG